MITLNRRESVSDRAQRACESRMAYGSLSKAEARPTRAPPLAVAAIVLAAEQRRALLCSQYSRSAEGGVH